MKSASIKLKSKNAEEKNNLLKHLSEALLTEVKEILLANNLDLSNAKRSGVAEPMLDRLMLNQERIEAMAQSLIDVIALADPVGIIESRSVRPNGLEVFKQRVPIGVIFMIFEARPNVVIDAAALAFKSGNAILLRGGKEAIHTNTKLVDIWCRVLSDAKKFGSPVQLVQDQSYQTVNELLKQSDFIDLVIPRGGENLIKSVVTHSTIPVLKHDKGLCHCFVDSSADIETALSIIEDGKLSRPSVCNALETLLVEQNITDVFWSKLQAIGDKHQLKFYCCSKSSEKLNGEPIKDESQYDREYLDKSISIKVVTDIDDAIKHIGLHGSRHTEVIVSNDQSNIERFTQEVDASVIMQNCSSRFSDGGELGLGAEIGISTSKLHAYGPMGLDALTISRYLVQGKGHIRHPKASGDH